MFQLLDLCFADLKMHQRESCELSFIWGKMRTIVWETAFQIALRNCSKEVGRGARIYIGVLPQRAGTWEQKKIVVKEARYLKLKLALCQQRSL